MISSTAIVLFNLGGPDDLAAVEPFLVNLFSDREIIELPFGAAMQPLMARLIAKMRGPSVRRNYQRIGGGSPQLPITRAQAAALEDELNAGASAERPYRVFIAMRYSRPSSADAVEAIRATGIRRIVTVTLFPHWSKATTGSSRNEFDRALADPRWRSHGFEVSHIEHYFDHPAYLDAMTDRVLAVLETIPAARRHQTVILFSAHGLPQKFIDEGDPYVDHIQATRLGILQRLNLPNRQLLAYQSRTGPVKWLGPGTEEVIRELGREGIKDLLVVPLSFVSDHIETLYEVDMLFADAAREAGIGGYYRPEALNTHPLFIKALADLVRTHTGVEPAIDRTASPAAAAV
ncbi:MAG: ferrochelatase [Acidobacteria bacterium RIFCSPLOWO2_02_FULL_67_36]|nr:MAG: ferrochelatase [Acidobacteria bacterium RIFCSPLOWO2_02_FULL_67_36]OFW24476.1 MAG: ferrochelatase [Acidobacteria bacterium RIFCSPLOWO2_12_FULL_66_21]